MECKSTQNLGIYFCLVRYDTIYSVLNKAIELYNKFMKKAQNNKNEISQSLEILDHLGLGEHRGHPSYRMEDD